MPGPAQWKTLYDNNFLFRNNFKLIDRVQNENSTKNTGMPFTQIHLFLTFYPLIKIHLQGLC